MPFLRWALGASLDSSRSVGCWGQCTQGLFRPHPPSPRRRARLELVSSSGDHQHSTGAQGGGGSPDPPRTYGEHRAKGVTGKRCFPELTLTGAELSFPRRVSLSRRQLPEIRFVQFLRWALGGFLPSWRRVGSWGQYTQGLFTPSAFSLTESTFGVGFQFRRPPAQHWGTGSRRQPRPSSALGRAQS